MEEGGEGGRAPLLVLIVTCGGFGAVKVGREGGIRLEERERSLVRVVCMYAHV